VRFFFFFFFFFFFSFSRMTEFSYKLIELLIDYYYYYYFAMSFFQNPLRTVILANNLLDGILDPSIGTVLALSWFDVSGNRLSGTIPAAFGSVRNCWL
jgi:hypothetical protein